MDYLIKKAVILSKSSPFHHKEMDILIKNGKITKVAGDISAGTEKIITGKKLYCCPGLLDIGTHSGEPGYEHRETLESLGEAARAGGYTRLALFPDNKPVVQTKAEIHYLREASSKIGIGVSVIGALSRNLAGQDLAEFMDMAHAGAVAFGDGLRPVADAGLMNRALLYAKNTGRPVIHHPEDHHLAKGGEMHEGHVSTSMGLRGVPSMAELIAVQRDIQLSRYNDAPLILHAISTEETTDTIRTAKKQGLKVFANVSYLNLVFTDNDLENFDTNLKVSPPIRSEADREALIKGLIDDTIDAIISNHVPLDEEAKNLEFPYANPGATGLETCLAACITYLSDKLGIDVITEKLTSGPGKLLGMDLSVIKEGNAADLCVFDADEEFEYTAQSARSVSLNNPFLGRKLRGKVILTIWPGA